MEGYMKAQGEKQDKKTTEEFIKDLQRGTGLAPAGPQLKATLAPISLSLNVDGTLLARVMSSISANSFEGQAPAFDGSSGYVGGDHQHTDKGYDDGRCRYERSIYRGYGCMPIPTISPGCTDLISPRIPR
jgi:hypothetical protein